VLTCVLVGFLLSARHGSRSAATVAVEHRRRRRRRRRSWIRIGLDKLSSWGGHFEIRNPTRKPTETTYLKVWSSRNFIASAYSQAQATHAGVQIIGKRVDPSQGSSSRAKIGVGSPSRMRDSDWPAVGISCFFDPAFPVGLVVEREAEAIVAALRRVRMSGSAHGTPHGRPREPIPRVRVVTVFVPSRCEKHSVTLLGQ